jgi:hypothetical protein
MAFPSRQSPCYHWSRRCACNSHVYVMVFNIVQALRRTMAAWRRAKLLFRKTPGSLCLLRVFRTHSGIPSTSNKHETSFRTLSASFTQRKRGIARLVLESLMMTELVVCRALFFCMLKRNSLIHSNRNTRHSCKVERHVPQL